LCVFYADTATIYMHCRRFLGCVQGPAAVEIPVRMLAIIAAILGGRPGRAN
jgi:hypothetical protein